MATKKFRKSDARALNNEIASDLLSALFSSPFKVQNWFNSNLDRVITRKGISKKVSEIFADNGLAGKKLRLTDLYQVEHDGKKQVSVLRKFGKVSTFEGINLEGIYTGVTFEVIGAYIYEAVPAGNNIFSFCESLDAVKMIKDRDNKIAEKERKALEREKAKQDKAKEKERKAATKKTKKVRNEEVYRDIDTFKNLPDFAKFTDFQLAKMALRSYYARHAA